MDCKVLRKLNPMRVVLAAVLVLAMARTELPAQELERLRYNHPGLVVDLGVGLWAWPLPMDFDGDGDLDLVVNCPDKPYNGVYFFENPGGAFPVFKPARRVSRGIQNVQVSFVDGKPRVLSPGLEYPDFLKTGLEKGVKLPLPANVHPNRVRANMWRYVDYDADGKLDLIIGVGDWTEYGWDNAYDASGKWIKGPLRGFVYLLRNLGTTANPVYDKPVKVMAGDRPVETFGWPSPNFADFDGDGDLDLLCGEFLDGFTYFENIGTRTQPRYAPGRRLRTPDGKPLVMDLQMITPTAVDWDRDGDLDLIVGDEDGRVALVEHTGKMAGGTPQFLPPRYLRQQAEYVKCGALATPVGFDWDGDGDIDLLCGNSAGYVSFFENLSGPGVERPKWAAPKYLEAEGRVIRIQAGPNGSIQGPCEAKWGYTTLSVADWDGDGLPDILVNSIWGKVHWYRNVGTRTAPKLAAAQPIEVEWDGPQPALAWGWLRPGGKALLTQWRTTPVAVDFNRDGLVDLVMLDHEGYLAFFERVRRDGQFVLLPPRRVFCDEQGEPLRLNAGTAGRSGRRKLCVVDWDGDGKLDVLVNSANAQWLRQVGTKDGRWLFKDMGNVHTRNIEGHDTSPTPVDWNGDGVPDLLLGAEDGHFYYLRNPRTKDGRGQAASNLFARENLVAWCIVPFDGKKRGPEERAVMLKRLGFTRFAYDWRTEHLPTLDAEMEALKRHGIRLEAFWFPATLNKEARVILDLLRRHKLQTQLWITLTDPAPQTKVQAEKVAAAVRILRPIAEEAAKLGCSIGLYNHGGWFGEPENQLAILEQLRLPNVGIVYNLHHGHIHLDRFPEVLAKLRPHLYALNLNGMERNGDQLGKKILPLGQGTLDLDLLRAVRASGYRGPIGILGHTQDDAEARLQDNLEGLQWLVEQLDNRPARPRPKPRTSTPPEPPAPKPAAGTPEALAYSAELVAQMVAEAKATGDARRGAAVFQSARFACVGCHKVGKQGGSIGPDLSNAGKCFTPEQLVESVVWPRKQVKEEYVAHAVVTAAGKVLQGYKVSESPTELVLRDPATGTNTRLRKSDIEERRETGTLMPEGLVSAMTPQERRDLFRFLLELGRTEGLADAVSAHAHTPATFPLERAPLQPQHWPSWQHHVNRDRVYDFYAKQAAYFGRQSNGPLLLAEFPGIDGGKLGHWGNQNETTWADDRWNSTDLGTVQCGVFRAGSLTVPKGVCVRLGERGELAVCFNPETLCYEALWQDGFVKFSSVRHGFLAGLTPAGTLLPRPEGAKPARPFVYRGFYRHGKRVLFSYTLDGVEMLDAPWVENGRFTRVVAPADQHPLAARTAGGPAQWPQLLETRGTLGTGEGYVVDTIPPPFANPWKALLFFGGHDMFPDGSALVCTMQGDVWQVSGLDSDLRQVRWRRFASGLHQALGLVVADGKAYVLGRDQITRLHDLNGDGEADFYECFSNAHITSASGHDYICGLERDSAGRFYTASSNQGLLRIAADGKKVEVLATGFRNPDGLGLLPNGAVTVPCSEGEWTPASMICLVQPDATGTPFFGRGGPRNNQPPQLPLVYLPRGLDNSSGGQVPISSDRWGPLQGQMIHFSYGAGSQFLLLREEVEGQPQGAVVPLPGEFLSGAHRGRFSPKDGQLYVTGMGGWGTYTVADGCLHRVRWTGHPVQLPCGFHVHQNGVRVSFTRPLDRELAGRAQRHFAQVWNYRYSAAYGSPEFSTRHPGTRGHDRLTIASAHVLNDGHTLFLEMTELQPVNQLHLHLQVDSGPAHDLFVTVHKLAAPFTGYPAYRPVARQLAPHPILADLALATRTVPNPWRKPLPNARALTLEAGTNLTFATREFRVRAGEPIRLTFSNPDAVPHNWVLLKPGTLERVGELTNKLIADPDAAARHYVPASDDVLAYSDVVEPQSSFTIHFRAPAAKGRYPYLCTFPGHWMVMNGQMIVE